VVEFGGDLKHLALNAEALGQSARLDPRPGRRHELSTGNASASTIDGMRMLGGMMEYMDAAGAESSLSSAISV